jgi:hypothetical protein
VAPAITHFLVGAALLVLLATPVALRYRLPVWTPLWLVALGGLWGLFPDVHHIAPVYETELRAFHDSRWAELFAFHYTLDRPAVRARYTASVFWAIASFLVATVAFTLATVARTRTVVAETAVPRVAALAVTGLLTLLFAVAVSG